MVDDDLLAAASGGWCAEELLAGLLTCEGIDAFRYSDNGPPAGAPETTSPWGSRAAAGWVTVTPQPQGGLASHLVTWSNGESIGQSAVHGDWLSAASIDTQTKAYASLDPDDATTRRSADALAALAAQSLKADLFITCREYLHRVTSQLALGVTFCAPAEALALIGLYLRSQGIFLICKDPGSKSTYSFNKGLYYWVGTRELLPEGWRWYTACVAHSVQGPDDLIYLGGAVFQRVVRVLRARDDLLRAMNQAQDNDVADDALTALDTCLVFLVGAVDATARVAHAVLCLPPEDSNTAAWQKDRWLRDVTAQAPGLSAVVTTGTAGHDTLTILRLLRNTVHAAGLQALAVGPPGRREETLIGLPSADASRVLAAADRQGGRDTWGLRELLPGRLHADPGVLLERLLPETIELLNSLMAATPVEQLAGVSLQPADLLPPAGPNQPFGERERRSIRWQLGL